MARQAIRSMSAFLAESQEPSVFDFLCLIILCGARRECGDPQRAERLFYDLSNVQISHRDCGEGESDEGIVQPPHAPGPAWSHGKCENNSFTT
jgi:hypothetical protein